MLGRLRRLIRDWHARDQEKALRSAEQAYNTSVKDMLLEASRRIEQNERTGILIRNTLARMKEAQGEHCEELHRVGGMEHIDHGKHSHERD